MSSKTKKLLQTVGMWFGAAVLIVAAIRAKKASDVNQAGLPQNFVSEIKSLFRA